MNNRIAAAVSDLALHLAGCTDSAGCRIDAERAQAALHTLVVAAHRHLMGGVAPAQVADLWPRIQGRGWAAGRAPQAPPQPLIDVLVWRGDPGCEDAVGWDLAFWGADESWRSATDFGARIEPPAAWWPLPVPGEVRP